MQVSTTNRASCATKPSHDSVRRRAAFARGAVIAEFRPRDARALDQAGFRDRRPNEVPKRLGEVAEEVTTATARKAICHWRHQAALAVTEAERAEALSIASKIAKAAGLGWPEEDAA